MENIPLTTTIALILLIQTNAYGRVAPCDFSIPINTSKCIYIGIDQKSFQVNNWTVAHSSIVNSLKGDCGKDAVYYLADSTDSNDGSTAKIGQKYLILLDEPRITYTTRGYVPLQINGKAIYRIAAFGFCRMLIFKRNGEAKVIIPTDIITVPSIIKLSKTPYDVLYTQDDIDKLLAHKLIKNKQDIANFDRVNLSAKLSHIIKYINDVISNNTKN